LEANNHKTTGIRFLKHVNVNSLIDRIPDISWDTDDDFKANYNKNAEGALRDTRHSILKFADKRGDFNRYSELPAWQQWKQLLLPIMDDITSVYGYNQGFYPKVMFANLPAHSFIAPHIDGDERGHVPHKIHVPLATNDKASFFLGTEKYHFDIGDAYEVNNGVRHGVANGGETDRIHLIFEYLDADLQPDYIRAQILAQ